MNKIGKNPNLVSNREEDLENESKTINAVVNALAAEADHLSTDSTEKLKSSDHNLQELGRTLHMIAATTVAASLPRPKSESNFSIYRKIQEHDSAFYKDPDPCDKSFHQSDTKLNESKQ